MLNEKCRSHVRKIRPCISIVKLNSNVLKIASGHVLYHKNPNNTMNEINCLMFMFTWSQRDSVKSKLQTIDRVDNSKSTESWISDQKPMSFFLEYINNFKKVAKYYF